MYLSFCFSPCRIVYPHRKETHMSSYIYSPIALLVICLPCVCRLSIDCASTSTRPSWNNVPQRQCCSLPLQMRHWLPTLRKCRGGLSPWSTFKQATNLQTWELPSCVLSFSWRVDGHFIRPSVCLSHGLIDCLPAWLTGRLAVSVACPPGYRSLNPACASCLSVAANIFLYLVLQYRVSLTWMLLYIPVGSVCVETHNINNCSGIDLCCQVRSYALPSTYWFQCVLKETLFVWATLVNGASTASWCLTTSDVALRLCTKLIIFHLDYLKIDVLRHVICHVRQRMNGQLLN